MNIKEATSNSTNYEMLKMILEANLNLMNLSEKSTTEEQEIITYSTLKGIMEFGEVMERSFNFAKS